MTSTGGMGTANKICIMFKRSPDYRYWLTHLRLWSNKEVI